MSRRLLADPSSRGWVPRSRSSGGNRHPAALAGDGPVGHSTRTAWRCRSVHMAPLWPWSCVFGIAQAGLWVWPALCFRPRVWHLVWGVALSHSHHAAVPREEDFAVTFSMLLRVWCELLKGVARRKVWGWEMRCHDPVEKNRSVVSWRTRPRDSVTTGRLVAGCCQMLQYMSVLCACLPQLGIAQGLGRVSRRLGNRGSISSKRGNKDFYKGKGGRKEGWHTQHGTAPWLCSLGVELRCVRAHTRAPSRSLPCT